MEWIILEALVALALGLSIVWWTLSPARRREREQEKRNADPGERDDVRKDSGDGDG
jgi:cbb3-type cytochrome oxidase subunit 3